MSVKFLMKRGDNLNLSITVTSNDLPVDITTWAVRSQLRDSDTKIADLVYTLVDGPKGKYTLSASNTTAWPIKSLSCDIEYSIDSIITSTETFHVNIVADVTR